MYKRVKFIHMKKRALFYLTFLLLLVYGCYDELSLPPHGNRDSGEFSISEARKYFEENATDLSFIHITDSARIHSRSVSRKAELSPAWERAVRTVGKEAVLVEIPLKSNAVLLDPSVILRTVNLRFQRVVSVMSDLLWHNCQMEMSICSS